MPASILTEILLRSIFEVVLYGLGYAIGWVMVPIFSLGRYSVEPWDFSSRRKAKVRSKQLLPKQMSADATSGIGLATLCVTVVIAVFIWRATNA